MVAEADGDGGRPEVVAFARWRLVREPLPEEEWSVRRDKTAEELGEGTRAEVYNTFIGGLHRLTAKWAKGDPCLRECPFFFFSPSLSSSSLLPHDSYEGGSAEYVAMGSREEGGAGGGVGGKPPHLNRSERPRVRPGAPATRRRLRAARLGLGARGPGGRGRLARGVAPGGTRCTGGSGSRTSTCRTSRARRGGARRGAARARARAGARARPSRSRASSPGVASGRSS